MKRVILLFILSISLLYSEMLIVANDSCKIESLSRIELKNLYLGLTKQADEERVTVFDRNEIDIYQEFVTKELKKSIVSLETYWVRMLFSGRAKPPKRFTLKEWIDYTNYSKECSITYIEENENNSLLKRIKIAE